MDLRGFYKAIEESTPDKLAAFDPARLERYYDFLANLRPYLVDKHIVDLCTDRMALLRKELELRRSESHADQQHRESLALGRETLDVSKTTLKWARWAVLAAVVIPIALALIAEIPFSKLLRAMSSQPSAQSSPSAQPTAAPPSTPTPAQTPSESPLASQTPVESATPAP